MQDPIFSSNELIGGRVYAALRSLDCKVPGLGKVLKETLTKELQHAMLFLEVPSLPEKLLCYEFGPHDKGHMAAMSVVPRSRMPKHAIEQVVAKKLVRVCDVTAEANKFASSTYNLLEGIERRYVNLSDEQQLKENNCQTFVDHMLEWITGYSNVVTHHILVDSPAALGPSLPGTYGVAKGGFRAAVNGVKAAAQYAQYAHLNIFSIAYFNSAQRERERE